MGEFQNNQKEGKGKYIYKRTNEQFEGLWKKDKWNGEGRYTDLNKRLEVIGTWWDGVLNGMATVLHENNIRIKAHFVNGKK